MVEVLTWLETIQFSTSIVDLTNSITVISGS